MPSPVRETRIALVAEDHEAAVALYRDALGLPVVEAWDGPTGRGAVLDGGRATIEVLSVAQAEHVEAIEAAGGAPDRVRLAMEVQDSVAAAERLEAAGAERVGGPVVTPWAHRNVRLRTPDGTQLTLFTVLESSG